jgi:hypothetical protein
MYYEGEDRYAVCADAFGIVSPTFFSYSEGYGDAGVQ